MRRIKYRPFEDARKYIHSQKLKSSKYWTIYCKSGRKPDDIPAYPLNVYKKEWKGMGDWLGTGTIPNAQLYDSGFYLPFEKARKFVHALNLKTQLEWDNYCKSGEKPKNIPKNADRAYIKQWKSYGDWLGTGKVANQNRKYRTYSEARRYVHSLKLKDTNEWVAFYRSGKLPDDIPTQPLSVYKKECKGIGDWLGTGSLSSIDKSKQYIPYKKARKFVQTLKLKNTDEWRKYQKKNKKLLEKQKIPPSPEQAYKNKGWVSFGDWLGTGRIANQNMEYRSFEDAKKYVQKLKIGSVKEWEEHYETGKLPDDIPRAPEGVYKKEWKGWGDFTGSGRLSPKEQSKLWLPIEEAKIVARDIAKKLGIKTRGQWIDAYRNGLLPKNMPMDLANVYDPTHKERFGGKK